MFNNLWDIKAINLDKLHLQEIFDQRNVYTFDENKYFFPSIDALGTEGTILGIDKAVSRINKAIKNNQKICIYGDYDADGTCSTAILLKTFKALGYENVTHHIPSRLTEGYGLNNDAINKLASNDVKLIITVDCGITSVAEIDLANSLGIDVILTDHHHCPDVLPKAYCIVNPHQDGCPSKFKNFCGAGLAYKLGVSLLNSNNTAVPEEILEIASIATVADIVELNGENRIIVQLGLELIKKGVNKGVDALLKVSGVKNENVDSRTLGFVIGPRLNSAGRIAHADLALNLLMAEDEEDVKKYASELNQLNAKRQSMGDEIYNDSVKKLDKENLKSNIVISSSKDYHIGILGIAASRLVEKYNKVAIVMAETDKIATGSLRSIEGFSIVDMLDYVKPITLKSGGHEMAGGLSVSLDKLDLLKEKLIEYVDNFYSKNEYCPTKKIDLITSVKNLTLDNFDSISKFEPFGAGNENFTFALTDVKLSYPGYMGSDKTHFSAKIEDTNIRAIRFNAAQELKDVDFSKKMDIAFSLNKNTYNGYTNLQLMIEDMNYSNEKEIHDNDELKSIHDKIIDIEHINQIVDDTISDKNNDLIKKISLNKLKKLKGKTAIYCYYLKELEYIQEIIKLSGLEDIEAFFIPMEKEIESFDNIVFLKNILKLEGSKNIYQVPIKDFDIYQGYSDIRDKMLVMYQAYKTNEIVKLYDILKKYNILTDEFYAINQILNTCKLVDISYPQGYNIAVAKLLKVNNKVDLAKNNTYQAYNKFFKMQRSSNES